MLVSGTAPIASDGATVAGDATAQANRCLQIIRKAVWSLGGDEAEVVRTRTYLTDRADWEAVARAHGQVFGVARPAATMVVVAGLLDPAWRLEIEAEAVIGSAARDSARPARVLPATEGDRAWVVAPAQWGPHAGTRRRSFGHTAVVDPWGAVVAQRPEGVGHITVVLDFARQAALRARLPALGPMPFT